MRGARTPPPLEYVAETFGKILSLAGLFLATSRGTFGPLAELLRPGVEESESGEIKVPLRACKRLAEASKKHNIPVAAYNQHRGQPKGEDLPVSPGTNRHGADHGGGASS